MKFTPDEPEPPAFEGGPDEHVVVFDQEVAALPPEAEATGVVAIIRTRYPDHAQSLLSFRISENVAAWEAEAMLSEMLEDIRATRAEYGD